MGYIIIIVVFLVALLIFVPLIIFVSSLVLGVGGLAVDTKKARAMTSEQRRERIAKLEEEMKGWARHDKTEFAKRHHEKNALERAEWRYRSMS